MRLFLTVLFSLTALSAGDLSNRRAPGFSLPDAKQAQHDLADYRGKTVLIEWMQTTCPHCAQFSTVLEDVALKYKGKVQVLSIVLPPDSIDMVKKYITAHKITTPILFDTGQMTGPYLKITPANPNVEFPQLFVIDGNGMIKMDFKYSKDREIFEGRALYTLLDKMVK